MNITSFNQICNLMCLKCYVHQETKCFIMFPLYHVCYVMHNVFSGSATKLCWNDYEWNLILISLSNTLLKIASRTTSLKIEKYEKMIKKKYILYNSEKKSKN